MGLLFERSLRYDDVHAQVRDALKASPPSDPDELEARAKAMAAAVTAGRDVTFNWRGFLVAGSVFLILLLVSIWVDWKNLVDDPRVYSGFASTALGAVLGYVTGEAVGTATN